MSIEIHQPELEALIRQRMASGAFRDVDELLTKALSALDEPVSSVDVRAGAKSFVDLMEPVRGLLTDDEVDVLFRRNPSLSRPLDL